MSEGPKDRRAEGQKEKGQEDRMKEFAVVANKKDFSRYIAESMELYFSEEAAFHYYGARELEAMEQIEEDYVILSAFTIFQMVKPKVKKDTRIIIVDLTLDRNTIDRLEQLPKNARALLVNIDYRNCMEVITMLDGLGYKSLDLVPYYPGCEYDESIKLAVTIGEPGMVPEKLRPAIDLGHRLIDIGSIREVAGILGVEDPFRTEEAKKMKDRLVNSNPEMRRVMQENSSLSVNLKTILKLVNQGVVITDVMGKIYLANDKAAEILKNRSELLLGFNVAEVLPEFAAAESNILDGRNMERLIDVGGQKVMVSVSSVEDGHERTGSVLMLEYFNQAEDRQHRFRNKIVDYGHKASYTFDQILGESTELEEAKKIAMRMAVSDSSVCLFGESGTGKELFAQSIHNYSRRKDYLFVAINCSALPENLLESELYGYEEGAFSGAKKGGKIGLFELAHKGTLFLDEIGELPMQMQAKLLRVLEEKKILKVGGQKMIDVDVRVICATNRNLQEMVEAGQFRRDLYYRLCVLPVAIPPLRRREDDLFLLMDWMKRDLGATFQLTPGARQKLRVYSWPGNVRELKNITEYLTNLGKELIEAEDIPFFGVQQAEIAAAAVSSQNTLAERLSGAVASGALGDVRLYRFILQVLEDAQEQGAGHMGRQALAKLAREEGLHYTEPEIRSAMEKLGKERYIFSFRGRKGSVITEKGSRFLRQLKME